MNDIIHLLPDSVANQIAAGEVIQRPASVIKELVENAIDAEATHVQILVTDAGRTCIQVIDNGKGMSETDARLAFERHATSKISKADDLFALRTMGFRGEALASIAAVAEVELRTRRPYDDLGVCLNIAGSQVVSQEPISCPVGANFAVRNLFYNVPARRKFLKANHTEMANILVEFERIAMAHPDVAFTLSSNGQVVHQLPSGNFRQRILALFGKRTDSQLLPVGTETELVQINGFVGTPESAKKKNAHQYFLTNQRFMRHPYFAKAIQTAYERLIPEGYQVPFFLNLTVSPAEIDVNVHPTKTEIKFTDEQEIWQILLVAVRESLGRHNAVPSLDFTAADRPDIPAFNADRQAAPPTLHYNPAYNPFQPSTAPSGSKNKSADSFPKSADSFPQSADSFNCPTDFFPSRGSEEKVSADTSLFTAVQSAEALAKAQLSETYYQHQAQYIITSAEQGLLVIDQHRASIRILYDTYRQQMHCHRSATQGLLFPQILQLTPTQAATIETITDDLGSLGFNISNLGGHSYSILGIPAGTEGLDPIALLQSIIDESHAAIPGTTQTPAEEARETLHHHIALALARKAAIPQGEILTAEDMSRLTGQLLASTLPGYTPDGHRIIVTLSPEHLSRLFG